MNIASPNFMSTTSPGTLRIAGRLMPLAAFPTCRVTGIWFGSVAVRPGCPVAGLHGDLTVATDGQFRYEPRPPCLERLLAGQRETVLEEIFSLNLSDTAGASCVSQLTIGIRVDASGIGLDARYQALSTVTERYCLTRQHGLALLCMETGDHFVMCEVDTPLSTVARSHQREFFGIGGQHLLRIDPLNGNTVWIGILDLPLQIRCLDAAPDGMLYGVDSLGDLYRIQPSNGATSLLVRLSTPSLSRGAMAYHEGCIHWTAADNRLHRYDLQSQAHYAAIDRLLPMAPEILHDRVIAMMPALDGGLFVATADGILRLDPATGGWVDTGVRTQLSDLVAPCPATRTPWGGREPDAPRLREPSLAGCGLAPALCGH